MKENMNVQTNTFPEVPWVTFSIDTEHHEIFERFCKRNQILYEVACIKQGEISYSVRDGIDAQDVAFYILRSTLKPEDKEENSLIYMLFQRRIFWTPKYEYEFHVFRTKEDEWMLSHFEDPLTA